MSALTARGAGGQQESARWRGTLQLLPATRPGSPAESDLYAMRMLVCVLACLMPRALGFLPVGFPEACILSQLGQAAVQAFLGQVLLGQAGVQEAQQVPPVPAWGFHAAACGDIFEYLACLFNWARGGGSVALTAQDVSACVQTQPQPNNTVIVAVSAAALERLGLRPDEWALPLRRAANPDQVAGSEAVFKGGYYVAAVRPVFPVQLQLVPVFPMVAAFAAVQVDAATGQSQ